MNTKNVLRGALLAIVVIGTAGSLGGCETISGIPTMHGNAPGATPPAPVRSASEVPKGQSTYRYQVGIYPGLDENFDPNPTLTKKEYHELDQLDWTCTRKTDEVSGRYAEMAKQGLTIGVLEGILGTVGTVAGFGNAIKPLSYLAEIGGVGLGGGAANGSITFDMALSVAHGYCMTGMVYKADELEHKLRRIFITPLYVGKADLPEVSDRPAPSFPHAQQDEQYLPPPPGM